MRILGFKLEFIPGDLGDSRFINFLLEHGHQWVIGREPSFWNAGFMFPFKNSIALSDNMIGSLPLYSLWRFLGFNMETSYQLWWLTVCALNYWICYFTLRKWNQPVCHAAILSWLFAFCVFNIGQLNYMQMMARFMVPVAFYGAFKMIEKPSQKYLLLYFFAIILQLAMVMYTGIYLLYFSLLSIVIYCFITKKFSFLLFYLKREQRLYTAMGFIAFLSALALLLLPYQEMSKLVGLRLYREVTPNLPVLTSYLFPHESSMPWRFLSELINPTINEYWLHYAFPGMLLFLTLIASPIYLIYSHYKRIVIVPEVKVIMICTFLIALVHVHVGNGISLYAAIFKFPGINSIRVPVRFMHVELFLLILTLGYFIRTLNPNQVLLFFLVAFADNMFTPELIPRNNKMELVSRIDKLKDEILSSNTRNKKIIAVVDSIQPIYYTHLDAMIASQSLNLKTINGYSSYCDDYFGEFFSKCNDQGLTKWLHHSNVSTENVLIIDRNKKTHVNKQH